MRISGKSARRRLRREREFLRAYGGDHRAGWVRSLRCIACGKRPCENAHIETGGMSRKADADKVVPLCRTHHVEIHRGQMTFARKYGLDLERAALEVEIRWRALHIEELAI